MRLAGIVLIAGISFGGVAFAGGGDRYAPSMWGDDGCRFRLVKGNDDMTLRWRASCDFGVSRLTARPSRGTDDFKRRLRLDQKRDPGDEMTCKRHPHDSGLLCQGHMGRDARATGRLRTTGPACTVSVTFSASGGADCDPPADVCPAIGISTVPIERQPAGCG